jgi:DNA-directed RNA polymerase specialized sigma24 family protein
MEAQERWMLRLADARVTRDAQVAAAEGSFRQVVVNAHVAGMTISDIHAATSLSMGTIRNWLRSAGRETDTRGSKPTINP